jgi:hypothetical protein
MWFEGKWMKLEDIILSEVSQDQKHNRCMFSLICGKTDPMINIHKNKHDHIQTHM